SPVPTGPVPAGPVPAGPVLTGPVLAADVAVVGGGPVGMWLAAELHRGGVRPVVLERRAERPPHSKALTLYPRTLEQFALRGLASRWLAEGTPVPSSHFALLRNRLDFSGLDTRFPFTLFLPQRRTEELLEQHLAELGVPYLRRHVVTGLRPTSYGADDRASHATNDTGSYGADGGDPGGVELDVDTPDGPVVVRAAYVVGCDGAASMVRDAAGIEFAGTPDTWWTILGDVELAEPPGTPALTVNTPGGSMYMIAIGGGRYRVAPIDHTTLYHQPEAPVTFAELQASTRRLAGTDFGMRDTPGAWLSRVGNAARQAACYRAGRVLLAGDAAHIHYPAGGQGLNLGLQDATNLAWKLAAEIRGAAPAGLLDSYQAERYPVGLDVIDDSLAQCGLIANPSREGIALRDRFNAFLGTHPSLIRELAVRLSGLGIRYPAAAADGPVAGQRVPDLDLKGGGTIYGLLHPARFVLLRLGPPPVPGSASATGPATATATGPATATATGPAIATATGPATATATGPATAPEATASAPEDPAGRLDVVTAELAVGHPDWAGLRAVLIRPDGYVAWASADPGAAPPLASWLR
ncbi:MAG: FAD-dependent monooxygenase, partial [Streptosporangiaceae bacterium]